VRLCRTHTQKSKYGDLMELSTQRLLLRDFTLTDLEAVHNLRGLADLRRYERDAPHTLEVTTAWLERVCTAAGGTPRTLYKLALTIKPDPQIQGYLSLTLQNSSIREWEIGWSVHPDHWGKGYAVEAGRAMLDFAFNHLSAHRVVAFCHHLNAQSARVMQKLGMQQEGILRETRWLNGEWWDEVVSAILDRDWNPQGP